MHENQIEAIRYLKMESLTEQRKRSGASLDEDDMVGGGEETAPLLHTAPRKDSQTQ
jgi:hypothetical protein